MSFGVVSSSMELVLVTLPMLARTPVKRDFFHWAGVVAFLIAAAEQIASWLIMRM